MRERVQSLARTTLSPPVRKGKEGGGKKQGGRKKKRGIAPPTSKVKARGLGAILKHFPSLSLPLPVHHPSPPIPPCLLPASSVPSRQLCRLLSSNDSVFTQLDSLRVSPRGAY